MKKNTKKILSIFFMFIMFVCTVTGCGDKEIENLKVKTGTLEYVYKQNSDTSTIFDDLKIIATYNDGTTQEIGKEDLTISNFSTQNIGTHKVTITYEGKSLEISLKVTNNEDELYGIYGVELPESISNGYNKNIEDKENFEAEFFDKTSPYVVGDDNPFTFLPKVTALDDTDTLIQINAFKSVVNVYLKNEGQFELVEGTTRDSYVTIDDVNQKYDFTEQAIGEEFRLEVKPYWLSEEQKLEDEDYTVTFDLKVVDGYNITTAKELGILNNDPNYSVLGNNMYNYWVDFLGDDITVSPQNINGVVLHDNLQITANDIPSQFFYNGYLIDTRELPNVNIYYHTAQKNRPFTFYGNYFTIDASQIPLIDTELDDGVSQASLFRFTGNPVDLEDYEASIRMENLSLIGNGNRTNDTEALGMGALIGVKGAYNTTTLYNCIFKTFYINMYTEETHSVMNVDYTKSYDSYQNSLFMWGGGTVNITRSELKRAGGPLMILQHEDPANNTDSHIPVVNVDDITVLESYVTGQETWFAEFNATEQAGLIASMSSLFEGYGAACGKPSYFIKNNKMNMIAVVMKDGFPDFSGNSPTQGKLVINGKDVINKMANEEVGQTINGIVDVMKAQTGTVAPIFRSDEGGIGYMDSETTIAQPADPALFEGKYLGLYLYGMGIALEYFHDAAAN